MRARSWIPVVLAGPLTIALLIGLETGAMPRGVVGEWEWPRLPHGIVQTPADPLGAGVGLALYAVVVGLGARLLAGKAGVVRESLAVVLLAVSAVSAQFGLHAAAPEGYGLAKWVTIDQPGASGYLTIARSGIRDPARFLRDYPLWIGGQDTLHIGTHPPGLFLTSWLALQTFEKRPEAAQAVDRALPGSLRAAFREVLGPRPPIDRAAIALIGALTLLASAATVAPLYLLARASMPAGGAWAAASLWPLVPSAVLFQPASDTAFPVLSVSALALSAWSARGGRKSALPLAAGSGALLAVGMQFSLVFLGVGLVAALFLATDTARSVHDRLARFLATGVGFLAVSAAWWALTECDPFIVWWINQINHKRFYDEFHRSYRPWQIANAVELVVGLGIPTAAWAIFGGKSARISLLTLIVLVVLTVSGRNLGEVGRLWLPFLPALVVAAGSGWARLQGDAAALLATVGLLAIQTIGLEQAIQVVYPF